MSTIDLNDPEVRQFRDQILGICLDKPKQKNPNGQSQGVNRCFYVDPEDPTNHCLIGEWVVRYHPDWEQRLCEYDSGQQPDGSAWALLMDMGVGSGLAAAGSFIQSFADNIGNPRKWKHVAKYILADADVIVAEKEWRLGQ